MNANEKNEINPQLARSIGAHSVLITGQGEMAVPAAKTLAEEGITSFTLMSFFDDYQETTESQMIRVIREAGYGASIRIIQASRHDLEHYLFPQETDLVLDCLDNDDSHGALEQSCRSQGLPIVMAESNGNSLQVALIDPHAKSLSLLFQTIPSPAPFHPAAKDLLELAAQEAGQLARSVLIGEPHFYDASRTIYDKSTKVISQEPLTLAIPRYPRMIMVGSDRRKQSKSTLCLALARQLIEQGRPVRVLKVSHEVPGTKTAFLEESRDEEKPRIRSFFQAGCERVARLIASEANMEDALSFFLKDFYETMDRNGVLLVESSTSRRFTQPRFFVHLTAPEGHVKTSAILTRRFADRIIESPFTEQDVTHIVDQVNSLMTE